MVSVGLGLFTRRVFAVKPPKLFFAFRYHAARSSISATWPVMVKNRSMEYISM